MIDGGSGFDNPIGGDHGGVDSQNSPGGTSPELQGYLNKLRAIPEVDILTNPPQDRITLVRADMSRDDALDIMKNGFQVDDTIRVPNLRGRTKMLVRSGHEVSSEWSADEIRAFNEEELIDMADYSHVIIMSVPDRMQAPMASPARQGRNVRQDFLSRYADTAAALDTYLDSILETSESGDVRVPSSMISGVIDFNNGVFIPNPQFDAK